MFPKVQIKIQFFHPVWEKRELEYATELSAGLDLRACLEQEKLLIEPGERKAIGSGLAIEMVTPGVAGFIFSRSGLGTKEGLVISQGVGIIDPDYRGEIIISLMNTSPTTKTIVKGQRIAQLIFLPVYQAELITANKLSTTSRGAGGFGHTG